MKSYMQNNKKAFLILTICLISILAFSGFFGLAANHLTANATTAPSEKQVDIMFTHDIHSHLNSFLTGEGDEVKPMGGFSRIKTLITQQLAENPDTLLVDGGDFSMGTLVQSVFATDASELRMLGDLGMVATTFGNHEFDYRTEGLIGCLNAAIASGDTLPAMIVSNIDWESMETKGLTAEQQQLKEALDNYGLQEYMVVTKGDVKIAIMGIFGKDALACAPMCVLEFQDPITAAAETVATIQANETVDMIVCLSHSGTWSNPEKSEDELLAKAVPEIDLIISGHTHTLLKKPIQHGDTYIVSANCYGKYLGSLSMSQTASGVWTMDSYRLIPVTEDIAEDENTQAKVDAFLEMVDTNYLSEFGYSRTQVLAQNNIAFANSSLLSAVHTEHNLGNILADSFAYAVENADTGDNNPVSVAVVPSGCIRDTFVTGDITVETAYNVYSLGVGPDGKAGYPLISFYLTGAELKVAAEIDASVTDFMTTARLYMNGLHFTFNPNRLILNKVTDCYLSVDGTRTELEDEKLYRVVCDLYSGQMLGSVTDLSLGLLSVQPKFADGSVIENIEDVILMENGHELKAWAAVASYIDSFADTDGDGISNVPATYAQMQGRKVVDDSKSLGDLLKNPNKYAALIIGVVLVVLIILVLLIRLLVKLVKLIVRKIHRH